MRTLHTSVSAVFVLSSLLVAACGSAGTLSSDPSSMGGPSSSSTTNADGGVGSADGAGGAITASASTKLPLEILLTVNPSASVTLTVPAAALAGATSVGLGLSLHNIRYAGEGTVSINGGPDLPIAGKFIRPWGGVAKDVIALDAAAVHAGDNVVTFKFGQVADLVTGFRVVSIGLVTGDAAGTHVLDANIPLDDPTQWKAPDESTVARGEVLYHQRSGGGTLGACSDCHTEGGADLQYFAYSNPSIVSRSMFHGFSMADGEAMASYVRSHNATVPPEGRPWVPVFQPGPNNVRARGAGLDAILPDDATFTQQVFGGAIGPQHTYDWAGTLDPFKVPIAFQLPDWHSWLPRAFKTDWTDLGANDVWPAFRANPNVHNLVAIEQKLRGSVVGSITQTSSTRDNANAWRFLSVREWDWMRTNGFDRPDHGLLTDGVTQPQAIWNVGGAFKRNHSGPGTEQAFDPLVATQMERQWFWLAFALNPGRGAATINAPVDYTYLPEPMKVGLEPPTSIAHHGAFTFLYGGYENKLTPTNTGHHLNGRMSSAPFAAIQLAHLPSAEMRNLILAELLTERTWFQAGDQPDGNFWDGWNGLTWGESVRQGLDTADEVSLHEQALAVFPSSSWASMANPPPATGIFPIACKTSTACPSTYPTCNAAGTCQ